jgi:hypothetical protein
MSTTWNVYGNGRTARNAASLPGEEPLEELVEGSIGQDVAVVAQEDVLVVEVMAHGPQALADGRVEAGVDEADPPVVDVALEQLDGAAAAAQDEVVRDGLGVAEEVLLDRVGAVPEAQDEVLVAEVRVVAHDMPQDGPISDRDHRLRDRLGHLAEAQTLPPAEQHDLHGTTPRAVDGPPGVPPSRPGR